MANVLKMAKIQSIQQLHAAGWSQRRIASELEIDRGTVARYIRSAPPDPNPAIVPTGSDGPNAATLSPLPAPASGTTPRSDNSDFTDGANPAILPAGSMDKNQGSVVSFARGRPGQCESYRELIQAKVDRKLTAQRIWQDLVASVGEEITVPVELLVTEPTGIELAGADIVIAYDATALELTDAEVG